jgi:hypothetical protein
MARTKKPATDSPVGVSAVGASETDQDVRADAPAPDSVTGMAVAPESPEPAVALQPRPVVRRLMITRAYRGADIQEQVIIPGPYYEDDPFLYNLAQRLVDGQYAQWM